MVKYSVKDIIETVINEDAEGLLQARVEVVKIFHNVDLYFNESVYNINIFCLQIKQVLKQSIKLNAKLLEVRASVFEGKVYVCLVCKFEEKKDFLQVVTLRVNNQGGINGIGTTQSQERAASHGRREV